MAKKPSLTRNFIMNILLTASSLLFPLITFPYISRILLPEGTGRVAFVTSIISYFSMIASLGIPTYGIRACAQVHDDKKALTKTVQEIFIINACMTICVYFFFFLAITFIEQFRQEKTLFVICGSTLFFNLIGMEWLYKALEQYQYITLRSILFKFISMVLMLLLVHAKDDYLIYGALTILASVGSNIFNFINVRKYISLVPCGNYQLARHLKPVFLFFALSVATTIYTNLDTVMLGFLTNSQEVGYYNAAVKVKDLLVIFVTALGTVLLPRISYYVKAGQIGAFYQLIEKAFRFVLCTSFPLCIYFIVMAKETILFLSGPAFLSSIAPMQILLPAIICIGLTNTIGIQMLVPLDKEKLVVYSTCIGAATDTILNLYFIPKYAASGAALGTLIAEIVVMIVQLYFIRAYIPSVTVSLQLHKIILALIPSVIVLICIRPFFQANLFFALLITAAAFFITYLSVLFLLKYEIK